MYTKLLEIFDIKRDEAAKVFILIFQSIFIGIFYGAFEIGASTLFLQAFSDEMIPQALLYSGIAGIIFTSIYSKYHNKIKFANLALVNLFFITVITALMRFGFFLSDLKWIAFIVFVVMGPLYIISLLGFWGTVSRMFDLRQGKRLFGLIDTGQVIGIIISSFSIPVLITFNFKTVNTLYICAISIFITFVIQFIITRKYKTDVGTYEKQSEEKQSFKSNFETLFKDRYIRIMVFFVAISMVVAFFIYNSFLSVSNAKYPDSNELAKFLGFFTGTVMIFSLIIKFFVYSNLMKTYGLRTALVLSPVVLFILTALAALLGSFGYTIGTGTFLFFFLLIVLSRLFSWSLKMSIEGPAFKLLYQSLDSKIRFDVQAKMDGVVNEFSALLAGLILTGLAALEFFKIIHFSYSLIFILLAWIYVIFRLYHYYKKSLESSLESSKDKDISFVKNNLDYRFLLENKLIKIESDDNLTLLKFSQIVDPLLHDKIALANLSSKDLNSREYIIEYFNKNLFIDKLSAFEEALKIEPEIYLKEKLTNIIHEINQTIGQKNNSDGIKELARSKHRIDRIMACRLIGINSIEDYQNIFAKLVRDPDLKVRKEAIKIISKDEDVFIAYLVDALAYTEMAPIAFSKLVDLGPKVIRSLEYAFYKTDIETNNQVQILRIMGMIGGDEAISNLLNKLTHNNREVIKQSILALRLCDFTATEKHKQRLIQVIDNIIGLISWNLAALASLNNIDKSEKLKAAIEEEQIRNNLILFESLSVAYDQESVIHVKENLDIGTSESIGFAIELLDLFVDDEIKPKLFPILEDISESEKVKQLENHYAIQVMNEMDLIKSVLNRNPNEINRYTKHCALDLLFSKTDIQVDNTLIAQIFNPDQLLSESSAILCHSNNPEVYKDISKRLEVKQKLVADNAIKYKEEKREYLNRSRVEFIKEQPKFGELPGDFIAIVSDYFSPISIIQHNELERSFVDSNFIFLAKGEVEVITDYGSTPYNQIGFFQKPDSVKADDYKIVLNNNTILYTISKNDINELLISNQDFTQFIINNGFIYLFFN
jgi:ATP/ADP translocase